MAYLFCISAKSLIYGGNLGRWVLISQIKFIRRFDYGAFFKNVLLGGFQVVNLFVGVYNGKKI